MDFNSQLRKNCLKLIKTKDVKIYKEICEENKKIFNNHTLDKYRFYEAYLIYAYIEIDIEKEKDLLELFMDMVDTILADKTSNTFNEYFYQRTIIEWKSYLDTLALNKNFKVYEDLKKDVMELKMERSHGSLSYSDMKTILEKRKNIVQIGRRIFDEKVSNITLSFARSF